MLKPINQDHANQCIETLESILWNQTKQSAMELPGVGITRPLSRICVDGNKWHIQRTMGLPISPWVF